MDCKMKIKHDCFSIFFCGCNQSQIFPRSEDKCNSFILNLKRVYKVLTIVILNMVLGKLMKNVFKVLLFLQ